VQHNGHIHARTTHEDAVRGCWESCGGTVEMLRASLLDAKHRIDIVEWQSMEEADERGLDSEVLDRLREWAEVQRGGTGTAADDICSVCRDELLADAGAIWSLPCGHFFHPDCIQPWFVKHHTCPLCRMEVTVEAIDAAIEKACQDSHGGLDKACHTKKEATQPLEGRLKEGEYDDETREAAAVKIQAMQRGRNARLVQARTASVDAVVDHELRVDEDHSITSELDRIFSRGVADAKSSLQAMLSPAQPVSNGQLERTQQQSRSASPSVFKTLQNFWSAKAES